MIGFILENKETLDELVPYTVDKVEARTGIDFFYELDNIYENNLEATIGNFNLKIDSFHNGSRKSTKIEQLESEQKTIELKPQHPEIYPKDKSFQCRDIAKPTGVRCREITKRDNQLCHFHQSQE